MKYGKPAAITLFLAAAVALASILDTTQSTTLDAAAASATSMVGTISETDANTGEPFTGQSMSQARSSCDPGDSPRFNTSMSFMAGGGLISWLAAGDFNGDGTPDTAVTSGDDAWILLGQCDGSLGPAISYSTGAGTVPNQLATADFNSDAKLDVVTANTGTNDVSLLPGNGDGTFQAPLKFATGAPAGSTPKFVATADFTGDGKRDVAAAGSVTASSGFVSVLPGSGDGSFQAAVTTSVGDVDFMTVGDFNRDNKQDLITVSQTAGVSILLGNGNGTFQPATSVYPGNASAHAAVGDLNGDGNLDLAVADSAAGSGGVTVLLGRGDGTFLPLVNPGGAPPAVTIGDFNGDGKADLAAANGSDAGLRILIGKGDGTFAQGVLYATGGATPRAMSTGDFDGDGKLDVALGNMRSRDVLIVLNKGDGTFRVAPSHEVGIVPNAVAEGDFDGNGAPDLVVTNRDTFDLSVLIGNGDGTFKPAVSYPLIFTPAAVAVGDFNADGRPDLAVTGSFVTGGFEYGSYETGIGVANGDAFTIAILLGNGDGTFAQPGTRLDSTGVPDQIVARDLNGDGKLDLVNLNRSDDNVSVFLGNGDGTFQPAAFHATGDYPRSLAVADFNSDGKPDIAVANSHDFNISLLFGNGDGTFQDQVVLPDVRSLTSLHAADFNGDGKQDLSGIHIAFDDVSIYLGNGDGTFKPRAAYTAGTDAWVTFDDSQLGDFNADGNLDIAVSDSNSTQVRILDGAGDGTFRLSPIKLGGLPAYAGKMVVADYDVDGTADIAVISDATTLGIETGFVSVLLNATARSSTEADIEDDDHRIDYSDGWHRVAHPSASDGHFGMNSSQSPQHHARLAFDVHDDSGSITYHYATSPNGGSADIYLDGVRMGSINYNGTQGTLRAPVFGQSVTFDRLGQGTHTLELRAINGSVYLDKFTLVSAASSAQPASGPGQTSIWQGTLGIGQDLLNQIDVGTGVSDISLVAEASNGIPIQLVLMDPSGSILSVAHSTNGVAVINHPITRTGLYQFKVVNFGLGGTSVWAAATPLVRRQP